MISFDAQNRVLKGSLDQPHLHGAFELHAEEDVSRRLALEAALELPLEHACLALEL